MAWLTLPQAHTGWVYAVKEYPDQTGGVIFNRRIGLRCSDVVDTRFGFRNDAYFVAFTSKLGGQSMGPWAATVSVLAASFVAIGLAGPASATDEITQHAIGTYEAQYPWGTYTWVATPCEDDADQCIKVTEFSANDTGLTNPRWSANAYWSVGSWITSPVESPDELVCGEKHTLTFTYAWDAAANTGWRSYRDPAICDGGKDASGTQPFTLTKTEPPLLPAPAE